MKEIWKPIMGYEGLYEVSNLGNVKSVERYVKSSHRGYVGYRKLNSKLLKPTVNKWGYRTLSLRKDNKYTAVRINRLVAQAFIPNPDNLPCVNHKDENKLNDAANNLEWCTYKYNNNYGDRNKKISCARTGMKFTDEHKRNISLAKKQSITDEFREKMRQAHLGKPLSEYHKQRIKDGLKKSKGV